MYFYMAELDNKFKVKGNVDVIHITDKYMLSDRFTRVPYITIIDKVSYNSIIPYVKETGELYFIYLSEKKLTMKELLSKLDGFDFIPIYVYTYNIKNQELKKNKHYITKFNEKSIKFYDYKHPKAPRHSRIGNVSKINSYIKQITFVDFSKENQYINILTR